MVDLVRFFHDGGYTNVSTYIASGNVIFDSNSPPDVDQIENTFEDEFLFRSEVFLRDRDQIRSILGRVPWTEADGVVEVSFLERPPNPEVATALEATAVQPEELAVSGSEVFFLRAGKGVPTIHKESTSMRILGLKMTRRGLATVVKIHDRFILPEDDRPDSSSRARGRSRP